MKLLENIFALFKVKTLVTLAIVFVFCYLAITGALLPDDVKQITLIVVSFYFGTQLEKNK